MQEDRVSKERSNWGEWWFHLTAPYLPGNATFVQRESTRRGRLASITVLFYSLFTLFPFFQGFIQGNPKQSTSVLVSMTINAIALVTLNRRGKIIAAGWVIIITIDAGFFLGVFSLPGGLAYQNLRSMDIIAETVLVIVAFFPPRSVFVIAAFNSAVILLWTWFGPHNQDIARAIQTNAYSLFYPPISLEVFLAILIFLWANSALKAISDLDVSEKMVQLERREIERQSQEITLKKQLEEGVQLMLETHVKAANGDFSARAPLTKENILWKLAYSLNNLLARLERFTTESRTHAITQEAIYVTAQQVRRTRATNQPLVLSRTGTPLDELLIELNALHKGNTEADTPPAESPQPAPDTPLQQRWQRLNSLPKGSPASNTPPSEYSRVIPMPNNLLQQKQEKLNSLPRGSKEAITPPVDPSQLLPNALLQQKRQKQTGSLEQSRQQKQTGSLEQPWQK
jgi:hypothetical protein